ncbi:MAG: hypothetical protein PHS32_00110 [Rhodoferax sp.]|uniref:hypothetical protein n=1 Tax=Rhodoferax sp. TaxID=50421 RepID=UPI002637864F|nr:hypothetical protein [Rhodoferax sp.]MDD5332119.1 hypothetical protein [Rhodoferax sp.]
MLDVQLAKEKAPPAVQQFSSSNVASVVRNVQAARAVLRTVVLTIESQEDGSTCFDDKLGTSRWHSAIVVVCSRLQVARDELMETGGSPPLDWFTPLTLAEALDAALWYGHSCRDDERLSNLETVSAAQVVIDSLDELLQECDAIGLDRAAPAH